MSTVSSLCAVASVTALASIGLAIGRDAPSSSTKHANVKENHHNEEMTAVALSAPLDSSPFAFAPTPPRRLASEGNDDVRGKDKRRSFTPQTSFSPGIIDQEQVDVTPRRLVREEEHRGQSASSSRAPRNTTWLRRLSGSMSTSRDTSRSRPGSAAHTNGSVGVSHSGSTTPMFPNYSPSPLPPNKLVKRTASVHSSNGSPSQSSRLPMPTFRRPATSHQRSATLHQHLSGSDRSGRPSLDGASPDARDSSWRHYFTPRVSAGELPVSKRRSSTSIPNPIRRVYPDRRYTPTLISGRDLVKPANVELDGGYSEDEDYMYVAGGAFQMAPSSASSPFPPHTTHFEESTAPRRSFSIGDLLSTGSQPLWRRPSTSRGKLSKPPRKGRPRVASEPQAHMGSSFSAAVGHESERPSKRRDLTGPKESQRSIYSSASSNYAAPPESRQEVDLALGGEPPFVEFTADHSLFVEPPLHEQASSPREQPRLPSATHSTSSARPNRVSAAHSEITSTIGSDSEYRSVGDNSTDYQSDTAYDSIQTRTTRSSSGRRGPHIETIFDESPPTFSSGKSTRLRDFLSDGQFGDQHGRFRHSTIEEEDSVASTPVRSMHNKSVTSTPSARPGAPHVFSSSPPTMNMNIMPDPDEIDWDAMDDDKSDRGLGIRQQSATPSIHGTPKDRGLPFRFGPTLRPSNSHSANSTPQRNGASPLDRTNLFDWAEQQPSPSHPSNSPPRPRTVHGKKDQDSRGSRPIGRRPASGMHARSHSVPVVPDLDGKRNSVVANKFGTWGVGSKAVTEDWNEDFDFDELSLPTGLGGAVMDERRVDSGHEMFVPRSIREQQENVVANIGLLREWGLLIEELKELRIRAVSLDMLNGPFAPSWREVDAMIELADQESEEHTLEPRKSPPSSPGFDYSAFEDSPNRPRQHSVKLAEPPAPEAAYIEQPSTPQSTPLKTRPRKDSELVAQSVIAALQSKRSVSDPAGRHGNGSRKVPFDTATLRHIVPYVHTLKRKVKDALRETEGLYSSPHRRTSPESASRRQRHDEPAFRTIFAEQPDTSNPISPQTRRERAATDHDGESTETPPSNRSDNLATRMQKMSLPS